MIFDNRKRTAGFATSTLLLNLKYIGVFAGCIRLDFKFFATEKGQSACYVGYPKFI